MPAHLHFADHVPPCGVNVGTEPVWSISVDDLLVYVDVFENPLVFLHFVEQRMRAYQSDELKVDDELDHFGLYLQFNHYARHAEEIHRASGAELAFLGYRSDLDRYFAARLRDGSIPSPLTQEIPGRVWEIVDALSQTSRPGRAKVSSFVLDLDGTWRDRIAVEIDGELERQATTKEYKPFSMHGQMNLTIACCTADLEEFDVENVLEYGRTVTALHEDNGMLVLILKYGYGRRLERVDWCWFDAREFEESELSALKVKADRLRRMRVAKARSNRKIGRNEQCPCGSGKKYKKCCLKRELE